MEVIGVGELDLAPDLFQVQGGDAALDGGLGPHVHEHGRLDHAAVGAGKLAAPGTAFRFDDLEHAKTPICPAGGPALYL